VTGDPAQDQTALGAAIAAVLAQAFSFASRDLGQAVEASQVVTLIQNISGVVSVRLTALYLAGASETLHSRLRAAPARFDPVTRMILPAQLLLLDAHDPATDFGRRTGRRQGRQRRDRTALELSTKGGCWVCGRHV